MAMRKKELLQRIAEQSGSKVYEAERVLACFSAEVKREMLNGGKIPFPGIGHFTVIRYKATTGRNPRTLEPIIIPARAEAKLIMTKFFKADMAKTASEGVCIWNLQ